MANKKTKKCAHIPCLCDVLPGEEYCGEACRDAGSDDVEIACQCDHPACPLATRHSAPFGIADLVN
jgi:hypothetical protein